MWPRPRPEIIGTAPPQAATIGASSRLTLSPTPPVECLSSAGPGRPASDQSSTSPESLIAPVSAIRSAGVIPRSTIAMASAPTCASLTVPSAMPFTRKSSWSSLELAAVALDADQVGHVHQSPSLSTKRTSSGARSSAARWASRRVCSWLSCVSLIPSAKLLIAEIAATRRPQWRATAVSCTVDMPTASAPSVAKARISAAVSKVGPETAR